MDTNRVYFSSALFLAPHCEYNHEHHNNHGDENAEKRVVHEGIAAPAGLLERQIRFYERLTRNCTLDYGVLCQFSISIFAISVFLHC